MAHYAMLNEYHFSADVDDIRGATLYSADDKKIGKVVDVIFDHDSGEVRYLVADLGKDRKVLVPANHVYRSIVDEDAFGTDVNAADIDKLPRFDGNVLKDEKKWRELDEEHRRAWQETEERLLAQYDKGWREAPVQHRHGSDRNITPDEAPATESSSSAGERIVTGADLTPHRLAGKFPGADPMITPGFPDAGETTLRPTVDRSTEASEFASLPPSERWRGFEESLRQNIADIRVRCTTCCPGGISKVA